MHCVFCFVFVNVMKGEAWAWEFKNEALLFYLFSSLFEVLPIAQQVAGYSWFDGNWFFERPGKRIKNERKEKFMAWAVIRNPDSRDYNEIFVCFVIKTFPLCPEIWRGTKKSKYDFKRIPILQPFGFDFRGINFMTFSISGIIRGACLALSSDFFRKYWTLAIWLQTRDEIRYMDSVVHATDIHY